MIRAAVRRDLPSGTVTFLFTDVEGSTRLLHELGAEGYATALAEHRRAIREACAQEGGVEVDTQGDAFFFAFPRAPDAVAAASAMTESLKDGPVQVRVGLHTGTPLVAAEGYVGDDVHFAARVAASGHGGQVILSAATARALEPSDTVSQGLLDLGEHRLRDIADAVSIFQLGDGSFPPLKTISNTNLPRPASSFVGREVELRELLSRIEAGARLVTLTGPGGSGKTRLAIEAAATLVPEYKAGVFWVGLAPLRDPALVTETISQTLGARDGLTEHVGERELLLLLDNLEQVVEAAPELTALLQACPNLALLVTSRELLRVSGEVEYPVPPLAEPEAVSLFCERAQLEPSGAIAELCARLDDLPLAVELAAARTKALSPAQILERLSERLDLLTGGRDADPRQQTLRATIEWSHELLSPEEQQLFARLSVFAGGCTLEAAAEVADADLDTMQSLVEKSLLRFSRERYWMLETIREYAAEKLEASKLAEELREGHAEYFSALAEEAYPQLTGSPKQWLGRLEAENDNLRTALDHLEAARDTQRALQLAGALWKFWDMRSHVTEGGRRLERVLAEDSLPTPARARALNGATAMALMSNDTETARARAVAALALYTDLGDERGIAGSIQLCGNVEARDEHFERALELFEDALGRFEKLGDDHHILLEMRLVAWMHHELGDVSAARALHEEVVRRAKATGDLRMQATSIGALGEYALREGRVEDALPLLSAGFRISRDIGERAEILVALWRFAYGLALAGRPTDAARVYSAAETMREEMGVPAYSWMQEINDETRAKIHAQLADKSFAEALEEGRMLTPEGAVELALTSID
jgi:predicted ATPase/class 3 adenylate cyclase